MPRPRFGGLAGRDFFAAADAAGSAGTASAAGAGGSDSTSETTGTAETAMGAESVPVLAAGVAALSVGFA